MTGSATPRPATAPPEPTSAPSPTIAPLAAGTVVEEHEVDSPKGSIHYHLRILADGGDRFTAEFSGFTSSVPVPVSATLMAHAPSVGDGITDHGSGDLQLGGPTSGVAATSSSTIDIGARPTQLGVLVTYSSAPTADGVPVELGPGKVLAVDPITWQIPARTTNVHPVDSPARPFAYGIVYETTASGAPKLYRIAHGDTTPEVAKRFGISVEDLLWLNPNLEVFGNQEYLYEGTVLNLDPEILRKH